MHCLPLTAAPGCPSTHPPPTALQCLPAMLTLLLGLFNTIWWLGYAITVTGALLSCWHAGP